MNVLKRIINLWRLSEIEIPKTKNVTLDKVKEFVSPRAKIVEMENPVEKIIL